MKSLRFFSCALLAVLFAGNSLIAGTFTQEDLFRRSKGQPYYDTVSFSVYNPAANFVLKIQNGPPGYSRISSASVWVNGTLIFSPDSFNQNVEWLQKSISLQKNNLLVAYLASTPGAAIMAYIIGTDNELPTISILSPLNSSVSNNRTPAISIHYNDTLSGVVPDSLHVLINGTERTSYFTKDTAGASWTVPSQLALPEGVNTIRASICDKAGNTAVTENSFTIDLTPPHVVITWPGQDTILNITPINIHYTIDGNTRTRSVTLQEGQNRIIIDSTDAAGNRGADTVNVTLDTQAPVVAITSPADHSYTNTTPAIVAWTVDGVVQTTQLSQALLEGVNTITRIATDAAGNTGTASITVTLDTHAPVVKITSPANGFVTAQSTVDVTWTVDSITQTTQLTENLVEGPNKIIRSASDAAGNMGVDTVTVTRSVTPPMVQITFPADSAVVHSSPVSIFWQVNGVEQTTQTSQTVNPGYNTIIRSSTNEAGLTGADTIRVYYEYQGPPTQIVSPANGFISATQQVTFSVNALTNDIVSVAFLIDGIDNAGTFVNQNSNYSATITIANGHHTFFVCSANGIGKKDTVRVSFNVNTTPPQTQVTISGTIVDGKTFSPLSGASVRVVETGSAVTTGADGAFVLPSGGFGSYKIKIEHTDYTNAIRFISADTGIDVTLGKIQILPLDTQQITVIPGKDTVVVFQTSGIQLDIPHNALNTSTTVTATSYSHIAQLPIDQPGIDVFMFCVDLKPSGATFQSPVTVRVPNTAQVTEGAPVPITFLNESSGLWEAAGTGTVTADGNFIEFTTNHFSTFHANVHKGGKKTPGDKVECKRPDHSCPTQSVGSDVTLKSGDLHLSYSIPGGPSFTNIDANLVYWSPTAQPQKILSIGASEIPMTPTYMAVNFCVPGRSKEWCFQGPTSPFDVSYVWDAGSQGDNLQTGLYPYGVVMTDVMMPGRYRYMPEVAENLWITYYDQVTNKNYYYGFETVVNRENSPYGAGWAIEGVTRLVRKKANLSANFPSQSAYFPLGSEVRHYFSTGDTVPDGAVVSTALGNTMGSFKDEHVSIIGSGMDGQIYWYDPKAGVYHPPYGTYDTLIHDNNGWQRILTNGAVERYSEQGLLLNKTDRRGFVTSYTYDEFTERIIKITDNTTGKFTQFEYDAHDKLYAIIDQFGRQTTVSVNESGDLVGIIGPDGKTSRQFEYVNHQAVKQIMPDNGFSQYVYDGNGKVVKTISPQKLETTFERSADSCVVNNLKEIDETTLYVSKQSTWCDGKGSCVMSTYSYPNYSTQSVHALHPTNDRYAFHDQLGNKKEYAFDSYGHIISEINAKNEVTQYQYSDKSCKCGSASSIIYPNGLVINQEFDQKGNLLSKHNSFTNATTSYAYATIKGTDYVQTITNALGQISRFSYDSLGNLLKVITPGNDSTTITYNAISLPQSITDPLGRTINTVYDSLGRVIALINPTNDTTHYYYDQYGNLSGVRDPLGRVTSYEYDIMGRLTLETDPAGHITRYAYDVSGRLDTLVDPKGHKTFFSYDAGGNLITSKNHLGISRHYTYDEQSKLTSYTNGRGQTINYGYDELQRLTEKTASNNEVLARFGYDNMGSMTYAANQNYTVNRLFDLAGRMVQEDERSFHTSDTIQHTDTITSGDFSRDYTNLVINGGGVVLDGAHNFLNVKLINGAVLKHLPTTTNNVHSCIINVQGSIEIDATSKIDVSGLGYLGGMSGENDTSLGRTNGNSLLGGSTPGCGGSHGGRGGNVLGFHYEPMGFPAPPYDDRLSPVQPGGGGGGGTEVRGCNGGGVVYLSASLITINGAVLANGENPADILGGGAGAGAGGTVVVIADTIHGVGTVAANGGNGDSVMEGSGGGGGGRIFVSSKVSNDIVWLVEGGKNGGLKGSFNFSGPDGVVVPLPLVIDNYSSGYTIDQYNTTWDDAHVIVDNASLVVSGKHRFKSLRLTNGSVLTHNTVRDSSDFGLQLEVSSIMYIDSLSKIDVSGKGYPGASHSASAKTLQFASGATGQSGGSYGGLGGQTNGFAGTIYGNEVEPICFGSGGSCGLDDSTAKGGYGGGRIEVAAKNIFLDGKIIANGENGHKGGGGSGGSINLHFDTLGGTGIITANGGRGEYSTGGGGGGRIALYGAITPTFNLDSVQVNGGYVARAPGDVGTMYLGSPDSVLRNHKIYALNNLDTMLNISSSSVWSGATVTLNNARLCLSGSFSFKSLNVLKGSSITHGKPLSTLDSGIVISCEDSIVVDASSEITSSSKGYGGGNIARCAKTENFLCGATGRSGGSYGGLGGDASGASNAAYGDYMTPRYFGSGGSSVIADTNQAGGSGGGRIFLTAPLIRLKGNIASNGENSTVGGAGSGGAILIDASTFAGTGFVSACGGLSSGGGSGGGGRISFAKNDFSRFSLDNVFAYGGMGASPGHAGTIYLGFNNQLIQREDTGRVATVRVDSDTLYVSPTNNSYDGFQVLVNNGSFKASGSHVFSSITVSNSRCELYDTVSVSGDVAILNNSFVTTPATTLQREYKLNLIASGKVFIDSTSKIDVTGCGYLGDQFINGSWTGAQTIPGIKGSTSQYQTPTGYSPYVAGGSYGGMGGKIPDWYSMATGMPNEIYGSSIMPRDLGSGGGSQSGPGGSGGGAVSINARSIECNGGIIANGLAKTLSILAWGGNGAGGGSGGSILLVADSIYGNGAIKANGGFGSSFCPQEDGCGVSSGGGGRIAFHARKYFGFDTMGVEVSADTGGLGYGLEIGWTRDYWPQNGSIFYAHSSLEGDSALHLRVASIGENDTMFDGYHIFVDTGVVEIRGKHSFKSLHINGSQVSLNGEYSIAGDVDVLNGSILTHHPASTQKEYRLQLNCNGTVNIDSSSRIDVSGKGYLGDRYYYGEWCGARTLNNAIGSSSQYFCNGNGDSIGGGSYGGLGECHFEGNSNPIYGDYLQPVDLGSGGGARRDACYNDINDYGGSGGGSIKIVAKEIYCNGSILSNGAEGSSYPSGSGSGGSIYLHANIISGSGEIRADGGQETQGWWEFGPGGGGGRIAIYVTDTIVMNRANITVNAPYECAGTVFIAYVRPKINIDTVNKVASLSNCNSIIGPNDTIYQGYSLRLNNSTILFQGNNHLGAVIVSGFLPNHLKGNITIDTVIIGPGASAYFEGAFNIGKFVVSGGTAEIKGSATFSGDLESSGDCRLFNGGPYDVSGNVIIDGSFSLGGELHVGKDVTLPYSHLYGQAPDTLNVFPFIMNVDGNFTMNPWSSINVSGDGYQGANYRNGAWHEARTYNNQPVPSVPGSLLGGSYGGVGGVSGSGTGVPCYGDFYNPNEFGTGGGVIPGDTINYGGNGGGMLRITAKNITLNGDISADARDGYIGAGGSGGSIFMQATDTICGGFCYIHAGGYHSTDVNYANASGGGGRIALYAKQIINDDIHLLANGGGWGYSSFEGGAGTIFMRDSIRPLGILTIMGGGTDVAPNSTPLPSIGEGHITSMSADTLYDSTKLFSPFVKGHLVKVNYDLASASGALAVTGVNSHSLALDTLGGNLFTKGYVGDPYIGVYAFDTIHVLSGARAVTDGLVFYNNIDIQQGSFTSFTGTQTGMRNIKGSVPNDIRMAAAARKPLPSATPVNDNNSSRTASAKAGSAKQAAQVAIAKPEKKAGLFARIADVFKKLFAVNKPQEDKKQAVSSKGKQVDNGVSLLMKKNEEKPVQVASAGVPDFQRNVYVRNVAENPVNLAAVQNTKAEKPVCKNGDPYYTYDRLDRVTSMTSPAGTTSYHYDTITGRLDKITSPEGKTFTYGYNHGQLSSLQYPNGITANYAFDDNGNLTDLHYQKSGSTVKRYQYRYDKNGMRDTMIDNDGVHAYAYDVLYQIAQATHPSVQNPLEQFSYDSVGNRLTDLTNSVYQYNELNQLTEDDSCKYQYDLDGNMTAKIHKNNGDTTVFTYDIENKLVQVQKTGMLAKYAYDAVGRRMAKTVNGVTMQYRYNNLNLVLELNDAGEITSSYTFGLGVDNPLAMHCGGNIYYYLNDGTNNMTALTDSSGNVCREYSYSVFGKIEDELGNLSFPNPFTYTGREWDSEVGLYFYRYRYFHPESGRFLNRDPIGLAGGDINLYRYVKNSPTNLVDPEGTNPIIAIIVIRAAWMAACVQAAWDGASEYSPNDKEKHCYFSCFYNRCMLLTDPVLDFLGGVMREVLNHKEGIEDSLNDIKHNIKGILKSYDLGKSCGDSCREKPCKEK